MEGKVGNIFESNFRYSTRNSSSSNVPTYVNNQLKESTDNDTFAKTKEKHVNHALRNSGIAAGVGVLLITPLVVMATKGKLPKPISNFLTKRGQAITNLIQELKAKPQMTKAEMKYLSFLQKTSNLLNAAKGLVFNVGPLKDVLFEKVLRKMRLGKVCDKITGFFEKTAVKMSSIAYKKSSDAFVLMRESFTQANKSILSGKNKAKIVEINGVSKTVEEWAKIAETKVKKMDSAYDAFRPKAVNSRYKKLAKEFDGLGDEVYDKTYGHLKHFVTSPNKWTTFITEDLVSNEKMKFGNKILSKRKIITNTNTDVSKEISTLVSKIEAKLDMTDKNSVDLLKRIKKLTGDYKLNNVSENPAKKKELIAEMQSILDESAKMFIDGSQKYSILDSRQIKKSLGAIKHIISTDKKGELEELLEIYRHILPKEQFKEVVHAAQKTRVSLNDAVYTETEKFVDKMRDLKSGSALTDVATTLLLPLGTTAIGMSMADTKEKKRSVALNLGAPLLVGVGTATWATIAMYSTGPSMILGLVTSTLANQVCSRIDKYLKKKDAEKLIAQNQIQNNAVVSTTV